MHSGDDNFESNTTKTILTGARIADLVDWNNKNMKAKNAEITTRRTEITIETVQVTRIGRRPFIEFQATDDDRRSVTNALPDSEKKNEDASDE